MVGLSFQQQNGKAPVYVGMYMEPLLPWNRSVERRASNWLGWTESGCYLDAANILFGSRKATIIIDSSQFAFFNPCIVRRVNDSGKMELNSRSFGNWEDTD